MGCMQTNKCINFNVVLYTDIGQTITIDTKNVEWLKAYITILSYDGRQLHFVNITSKLTRVFDSLFSEFE